MAKPVYIVLGRKPGHATWWRPRHWGRIVRMWLRFRGVHCWE